METLETKRPANAPSFSRARSWNIGFHVVLSSIALLAVLGMLNYLAHRHDQRFYLASAARHKLTPLTLQILGTLTNKVKVIVFFDRREPLFSSVANLAKEYQAHSPNIDLEFVDYRMPGRAQAVRLQYKVAAEGDSSRIIFDSGGQVRTVLSSELSDYGMKPGKEIVRTGFKGEQLFTSAILNVTQTKPVLAYFLQGHGEHRLSDDDEGYGRFGKLMANNNVVLQSAGPLVGTNAIPAECGLIIIAGPNRTFEKEELARLDQYLSRGGRLMVLFNANVLAVTGLEALLYKWNIQVGFDVIRDTSQSQSDNNKVILTSSYGPHPMLRSLLRSAVMLVMPRSVSQRPTPENTVDSPKVTELLYTSSGGVQLVPYENNTWVKQKTGAIPLAAAGERGAIQGLKSEKASSRYIVVGDSFFLSNALFNHAANSDFANLAINWLTHRDNLLAEIGPSPVSEYEILLTEKQMSELRWLFLAVIPGGVVLIGVIVWLRRRF
jgi:ABC-type uncharacterized transport system involved in gliding motility auxiliary subunit